MLSVSQQAAPAPAAAARMATLTTAEKNQALSKIADNILKATPEILAANQEDLAEAEARGTSAAMLDRLRLSAERLQGIAQGVRAVVELADPIGQETGWTRPNGLSIRKVRVPLGVIGIIYEARPNVTVDTAVLALKAGCACILRGSASARHSNLVLSKIMRRTLAENGLPEEAVIQLEDTSHDSIDELVSLRGLVDCVIPRGGAALIKRVAANAKVPVIETGVGNCHLYVHRDANISMALSILLNGKIQRPSVCNALETLLIDRAIAPEFLPLAARALQEQHVKIHGCPEVVRLIPEAVLATEKDWAEEYLDLEIAVAIVDNIEAAIHHIARYSTGHSEAIITENRGAARQFQREVNSCAVYVNASTRFTDGGEFGFGAEVGISTQKLHARGPLGLNELTTCKYLIDGDGQVR